MMPNTIITKPINAIPTLINTLQHHIGVFCLVLKNYWVSLTSKKQFFDAPVNDAHQTEQKENNLNTKQLLTLWDRVGNIRLFSAFSIPPFSLVNTYFYHKNKNKIFGDPLFENYQHNFYWEVGK